MVIYDTHANVEPGSSGVGIQIDHLPQSESEKRQFVQKSLDQARLMRNGFTGDTDVTVDTVIGEIYAKSQRDIRHYSTLFSFMDAKRTFESTVIKCNFPMDEKEDFPQANFVINHQRVYEELLIFNDSLISASLANDRIKEGVF